MPGMNMGPGGGRPWPNPTNANSRPYSSASPGNYVGPPGGGGPPGTPAGDQPQLIQGIRRRDGLGDYLYAN